MKNEELVKKLFDAEEVKDVKEVTSRSVVLEVESGIRGIFQGITDDTDSKGREIKLLILKTKDGLIDMAIPTTLMRSVKNLEEGDDVAIYRIEDGYTKENQAFKQFKVFCRGQ